MPTKKAKGRKRTTTKKCPECGGTMTGEICRLPLPPHVKPAAPKAKPPPEPIETLPNELLIHIASTLSIPELLSFGATNRQHHAVMVTVLADKARAKGIPVTKTDTVDDLLAKLGLTLPQPEPQPEPQLKIGRKALKKDKLKSRKNRLPGEEAESYRRPRRYYDFADDPIDFWSPEDLYPDEYYYE